MDTIKKKIMRKAGFNTQIDLIEAGKCPYCEEIVNKDDFVDEKSINNYGISGLCQKCQNKIFGDK